MRVTDVVTHLISVPWTDDPWFPSRLFASAFIEVKTDSTISGFGETTLGYFSADTVVPLVEYFRPVLMGQDPMAISSLTRRMYDTGVWWARSGAARSVIGGIELALWDLKGKAHEVPVYEMLGGRGRDRVPVYASGGPSNWPIEENVRRLHHYKGLGYGCAKLSTHFYELPAPSHDGLGPLSEVAISHDGLIDAIASNFETLRAEFGGDMDLAVDGHQGGLRNPIGVSEAAAIANALAPFRLRFFEEPLAYGNVAGYVELRRRSQIPIAGGESLSGLDQFHGLISSGAVDIVQPDVGFVGGLLETLRVIHDAEAHNATTAIHTGASVGPGLAASWHIAATTQSVEWLETVVAARSAHADLLGPGFVVESGAVGIPDRPGLGVNVSPEALERFRYVPGSEQRT